MKKILLRFYEELNDFLPLSKRRKQFEYISQTRQSIKDIIESCGVPHTQVDLILVNSRSVDFSYIIESNDKVSVYPVFESLDIEDVTRLRPKALRQTKFILDVHLGKLVRLLRMLGFDTAYNPKNNQKELIRKSKQEKRILISCSRELMKHKEITHGYCLRDTEPKKQLKDILIRFNLLRKITPFSRCFICNAKLQGVKKSKVKERIPPKVRKKQDEFTICPDCDKLYWKGTHFKKMKVYIRNLKNEIKKESYE